MTKQAFGFTALLLIAGVAPAAAQQNGVPANCHGQLTATLASGRPHGDPRRCAAEWLPDIVKAVREVPPGADTTYMATLVWYASAYRNADLFQAAAALAQNRAASRAARMGGLLILSSQIARNLAPRGSYATIGALLSQVVPLSCSWEASTLGYAVEGPLPTDHLDKLRALATALTDPGEDPAVRIYAGCMVRYLDAVHPVPSPAGAIQVANKCGTVFTARNSSSERVSVTWRVSGSSEPDGEFIVPPHGSVTFNAFDPGTLHAYVGTNEVATVASTTTPCR